MSDFLARIKPKRSTVSGETPTAADLQVSELAVNTADGKLFTKHTDGSIKEISGSGGGGGGSATIEGIGNVEPRQQVRSGIYSWNVEDDTAVTGGWQWDDLNKKLTLYKENSAGEDLRPEVVALPTTGILYFAADNSAGSYTEDVYTNRSIIGDTIVLDLVDFPHQGAGTIYITFADPYLPASSLEDDILVYDAASAVWRPEQLADVAPVVSVNNQTGAVSLGIQEMDDFEPIELPSTIIANERGANYTDVCDDKWVFDLYQASNFLLGLGQNHPQLEEYKTLIVGDTVTFTWPDDSTTETTVEDIYSINSSDPCYLNCRWFIFAGADPAGASLSGPLKIQSTKFTSSASDPLGEGDILQWDDADQKFKPAQLPAIPGPAPVDSVNGQTGAVSLGIQDMNDFGFSSHSFSVIYRTTPAAGQIGASNTSNENFLYVSKTDQDGNTVDLSALQAAVAAEQAKPSADRVYPSIYNLNGAYGTTSRIVVNISDLGGFYDLTISGDPVEGTGGRGWPRANCFSGCDPQTNTFPDGAEMVFGPIVPSDGDVLQWDAAGQEFRPSQTRIQGQEDFELNPSSAVFTGNTSKTDSSTVTSPGEWWVNASNGNMSANQGQAIMGALEVGDSVTFEAGGISFTTTVTGAPAASGSRFLWQVNNSDIPQAFRDLPDGTAMTATSSRFASGFDPLANGDILQWVDADQKFKPAQPVANLNDLGDVDISTPPINQQALAYDAVSQKWVPTSLGGSGGGGGVIDTDAPVDGLGYVRKDLGWSRSTIEDAADFAYPELAAIRTFENNVEYNDNTTYDENWFQEDASFVRLSKVDSLGNSVPEPDPALIWMSADGGPWYKFTSASVSDRQGNWRILESRSGGRPDYSAATSLRYSNVDPTTEASASDLQDGQLLTWNSAEQAFKPELPRVNSLDDLRDVAYNLTYTDNESDQPYGFLRPRYLGNLQFDSFTVKSGEQWSVYANLAYGLTIGTYVDGSSSRSQDNAARRTYYGSRGIMHNLGDKPLWLNGALGSYTDNTPELRWTSGNPGDTSGTNNGNYVGIKLPADMTQDSTYLLPKDGPTEGYFLKTDANGQTSWAEISTRIQDLDDFELELDVSTGSDFVFPNKDNQGDTSNNRTCPNPGDWAGYTIDGNTYIYLHNDANSQVYVTGETVTLTLGTGESFTGIISSNETTQPSWAMSFPVSAELSLIAEAGVGVSLTITDYAISPTPLAEGDVLQWNDADQKFKPAQVAQRIQDQEDFGLAPSTNLPQGRWANVATTGSGYQSPGNALVIDLYGGERLFANNTDSDGVDFGSLASAAIAANGGSSDVTFYCSRDGGSTWTTHVAGTVDDNFTGDSTYLEGITPTLDVTTDELRITFADPALSLAPLAEGDILQWDDADQVFKPSSDYISLTALKAEVAAATDFADFQSRIAAL